MNKTKKQYHFLSGMPRSGATVLSSILSQNPAIHATGTSHLYNIYRLVDTNVDICFNDISKQRFPVYRSLMETYHQHIDKPVIVNKNHGWTECISLLEQTLEQKPKIITTVRDITEIYASMLLVIDKHTPGFFTNLLMERGLTDTVRNRCEILWSNRGHGMNGRANAITGIHLAYNALKRAFSNYRDCLHIVEYDDIVNNTDKTIKGIYNFLELKPYKHSYKDLINREPEDDVKMYGIKGLHDVQPVLKRYSPPAIKVLGKETFNHYTNLKLEFWKNK